MRDEFEVGEVGGGFGEDFKNVLHATSTRAEVEKELSEPGCVR